MSCACVLLHLLIHNCSKLSNSREARNRHWTPDRERNSGPCECVREILLMAGNERDFGEAADKSRRGEREGEGGAEDKDKG